MTAHSCPPWVTFAGTCAVCGQVPAAPSAMLQVTESELGVELIRAQARILRDAAEALSGLARPMSLADTVEFLHVAARELDAKAASWE